MQTPHCISPFFTDYPASGNSPNLPTQAPGPQNSYDPAPIVVSPQAKNTPPMPGTTEYNPPEANENDGNGTELIWREGFGVKSDKFVMIFTRCRQV